MFEIFNRITRRADPTRAREVMVDRRFGFLLYTMPKCGSGTAKDWFLAINGVLSEEDIRTHQVDRRLGMDIHDYLRGPGHHFCPTIAELPNLEQRYKKLAVVRNPYSRIVSFYCEKILKEENRLPSLNVKQRTPYPHDLTFRELVAQVVDIADDEIEIHLRSQVYGREHIAFDHILKIERFEDDLRATSADLNIPMLSLTPQRNRTAYANEEEDFVYDRKPDELRGRRPPRWRYFFDAELKNQIAKRYQRDLEAFDYDFPD